MNNNIIITITLIFIHLRKIIIFGLNEIGVLQSTHLKEDFALKINLKVKQGKNNVIYIINKKLSDIEKGT